MFQNFKISDNQYIMETQLRNNTKELNREFKPVKVAGWLRFGYK